MKGCLDITAYEAFLKSKVKLAESFGFEISETEVNPALKPHAKAIVRWMVAGGRRGCFASFGLGKTVIQLETIRLVLTRAGGRGLIIIPLGVRQEFVRDAVERLGWTEPPKFIRRIEEAGETGIYLTNYETVRDGKLDPTLFVAVSLDEASVLRSFGTKTFGEFMRLFAGGLRSQQAEGQQVGSVKYRFVATATPSPNEYLELLSYSSFLGVGDIGHIKTRFFKRDSTQADNLTLHEHKEREFWLWVASWAMFIQRPSDLGYPDDGYVLPPIDVRWHEVPTDHRGAGIDRGGQGKMFREAALGVQDAAAEKRSSLPARLAKLLEIRAEDPAAHRILWHDLEDERRAIEEACPTAVSIYGTQELEDRERIILQFSDGEIQELAAKPVIAGSGCNFQRHCAWAIFLGIGFKFNDFIQAIHRIQRFLQERPVRIDLIYTEAEREVRKVLEKKWRAHVHQVEKMTGIIREFGLTQASAAHVLTRKLGVARVEVKGAGFTLVNNDNVLEAERMESNSVGLGLTSIPFSSQYEYSPNYSDFGHTEGVAQFFRQMDFLTPNTLRVLMPGRMLVVHVKDRVVPGGMTGLSFSTVYEFHADCIAHYKKHGFAFIGMKTIVTDVVRENNQTYRLGWAEQCKDGSRMGCGMSEYLLYFRKPQTDLSRGYADVPVVKSMDEYSLGRWQVDAHGFLRSSGNRLLAPEELKNLNWSQVYQLYREFSRGTVYDYEAHVRVADALREEGRLPVDFMLIPPQSWHPDVWTDVTRMRTLNSSQKQRGQEMHLCPMQFDIAKRVIAQCSNPLDVVWDMFSGLGTVPLWATRLGRVGLGCELNPQYFADSVGYLQAESDKRNAPTLFDLDNLNPEPAEESA